MRGKYSAHVYARAKRGARSHASRWLWWLILSAIVCTLLLVSEISISRSQTLTVLDARLWDLYAIFTDSKYILSSGIIPH
jgi:hypothetical protein